MVVTVMKTFDAPQIDMPYATKIEKLENRRNTTFIWATKDGFTVLDDMQFPELNSPEYAEVKKIRLENSVGTFVLLEGF